MFRFHQFFINIPSVSLFSVFGHYNSFLVTNFLKYCNGINLGWGRSLSVPVNISHLTCIIFSPSKNIFLFSIMPASCTFSFLPIFSKAFCSSNFCLSYFSIYGLVLLFLQNCTHNSVLCKYCDIIIPSE